MPGPLEGIRVLDLTQMISGPLGAMILADQGADVIKVESRQGDSTRAVATGQGGFSASFLNNNRNKRSIVLDLKTEGGKEILFKLAATCDVFMQNFRPGVVERLGIGYEDIAAINPEIVYASISGFGDSGPFANKPVFDPLVQSLSGLTTVQAGSDDMKPSLVRTILPDKLTGFTVAQGICSALLAKERTGDGQHIRLSMLDTVIHFLWSSDMGAHTFVGSEPESERAQSFIDLIYRTRDGHISVAAFRRSDWEKLADACERPEWKDDERFKTSAGLEDYKDQRLELTQEALLERSTEEWLERLNEHDVPCAPVLTRTEMIRHPQVVANGIVFETNHPEAGEIRQTNSPLHFSKTPSEQRFGGRALGADTASVLSELGYDAEQISGLLADGSAYTDNH